MRIAMLACGHPVDDARVTHKQAASLARMGHEVLVFGRPAMTATSVPGVAFHPLPSAGGRSFLLQAWMLRRFMPLVWQFHPDIVVCHEPESSLVGLWLKLAHGVKFIWDCHECAEETLSCRVGGALRPMVRWATLQFLRFMVPRADWVTVVSPPNQELLNSMRRDGRVDIVHNSPPMDLFPLCDHDAPGPVTVVHEGHLGGDRGMVEILESLALVRRHRPVRLLVVGSVRSEDKDLFDRKVKELGIEDAVIMPGWVSYDKVGELLSQGQIGIIAMQPIPNNFRSLSNKLYNYMCCGQPVIAPLGSASADLVRKYQAGLGVDTSDPDRIAEAISLLAADVDLRKRMGANGRRAVEKDLGWHRMEDVLGRIYARLGAKRIG